MNEQKVLLTPAISGRETEFKINLFLESDFTSSKKNESFKKIIFENGMQCFLGELDIGDGFLCKDVLIGVFEGDNSPLEFIQRMKTRINQNNRQNHMFMMLGGEYPLTIFPHLYCSRVRKFLLVTNDSIDKSIVEIIGSIRETKGRGYYCSDCEHYDSCFSQQSFSENLEYLNNKPANLYFLEACCLNLLEEAQLASCSRMEEYNSYLQNLGEANSLRVNSILENKPVILDEKDVSKLIIRKLMLFKALVNFVIDNSLGSAVNLSDFAYDNFYIKGLSNNGINELVYLPIMDVFDYDRLKKLELINEATARIINENNHYFVEFRKSLADDSKINVGDSICIYLQKNTGKETAIICQVKSEDNDYYLLEMESKNILFTDSTIVPDFMQDMYKPVDYFLRKNFPSPRDEMYFLLLTILLRNSVLGEDDLLHAKNILFSMLNKKHSEINSNDIAEIIHSNSALSIVFRQENLFYKPSINVVNKLPEIQWLNILVWMIQFSEDLYHFDRQKDKDQLLSYLESARDKICRVVSEIEDLFSSNKMNKREEKMIIKNALQDMVKNIDWLNRMADIAAMDSSATESSLRQNLKSIDDFSMQDDNTILMPKK